MRNPFKRRIWAIVISPDTECGICRQPIRPGDPAGFTTFGVSLLDTMSGKVTVAHGSLNLCVVRLLERLGDKEAADRLAATSRKDPE